MDHFRITQRCAACELPTNGIFNTAHDIIKKLAQAERLQVQKQGEDEDEEKIKQTTARVEGLCSSSWQMPSDFSDSRKGKTSWL
jgi:hypothetical protein